MAETRCKFSIGDVVRHRDCYFRGVVRDVDPEFNGSDAWLRMAAEEVLPVRDRPFYHVLAEVYLKPADRLVFCVVYAAERDLLPDTSSQPVGHPDIGILFDGMKDGACIRKSLSEH